MERKGSALLPLHYGHPPEYLFKRMVKLGGLLSDLIIERFGIETYLEKISDPFWFHSLSLAIGFDWNSSGTTTATMSALKEYYKSGNGEVRILGGKGTKISNISSEFSTLISEGNLRESDLLRVKRNSRQVAKIDQSLLQDGFDLYMHFIVMGNSGRWAVVQQGMNGETKLARRYHWIDKKDLDFYNDGREGIAALNIEKEVLDLSTRLSEKNRNGIIEIISENPLKYYGKLPRGPQKTLDNYASNEPVLRMDYKINWKKMKDLYEYEPDSFDSLLNMKGVGKSTVRALSYLAEIVYGDSPSYKDPVKYSFALGGKDGVPKPVDVFDYDKAIEFYEEALGNIRSGSLDKERIMKNLSKMSFRKTHS